MPDEPTTARRRVRATALDVARLAGVSQPTVSRAFTSGASITAEKRDRVLKAAKALNYLPNGIASGLASARTNIVAVISGNMDNPFYAETLQGFVRGFQATGRQVLTFAVEDGRDSDATLMQAMRYSVDGIVVTSAHLSSDIMGLSEGLGIPIVMFNRHAEGASLPGVHCDNRGGGRLLADLMHRGGARRILIMRGDPQGSTSRDRVQGFREGMKALGVGSDAIEEINGESTYAGARQVIESRFSGQKADFPDAIFAVGDIMALGCADALRETIGLRIPEDIQLAGFDGIREAQRAPYRLTTVRQPVDQMVQATIALLDAARDGENTGQKLILPGELVIGSTVRRATLPPA